jgi:hypothetical protein
MHDVNWHNLLVVFFWMRQGCHGRGIIKANKLCQVCHVTRFAMLDSLSLLRTSILGGSGLACWWCCLICFSSQNGHRVVFMLRVPHQSGVSWAGVSLQCVKTFHNLDRDRRYPVDSLVTLLTNSWSSSRLCLWSRIASGQLILKSKTTQGAIVYHYM